MKLLNILKLLQKSFLVTKKKKKEVESLARKFLFKKDIQQAIDIVFTSKFH